MHGRGGKTCVHSIIKGLVLLSRQNPVVFSQTVHISESLTDTPEMNPIQACLQEGNRPATQQTKRSQNPATSSLPFSIQGRSRGGKDR